MKKILALTILIPILFFGLLAISTNTRQLVSTQTITTNQIDAVYPLKSQIVISGSTYTTKDTVNFYNIKNNNKQVVVNTYQDIFKIKYQLAETIPAN